MKFGELEKILPFRPVSIAVDGAKIYLAVRKDKIKHYIKIDDFKPYFYTPKPDIVKQMKYYSEFIPVSWCRKIEVNHPSEVKTEREKYPYTYEADILYDIRFYVDLNITYSDRFDYTEPYRMWFFDIEVYRGDGKKEPSWTNPNHYINSIAIYDSYDEKVYFIVILKDNHQLNEDFIKDSFSEVNVEIIKVGNELELLSKFIDLMIEKEPDILTGWYIVEFDIPYIFHSIINRYPQLINKLKNVMFNKEPYERTFFDEGKDVKTFMLDGINFIDYRAIYMRYSREKQEQYSLNYIADVELGKGKVEYEGDLERLYDDDINLFCKYNIMDTLLVKELEDKLSFLDFIINLSDFSGLPLYYFNFKITTKLVECIIMKYLRAKFTEPLLMRTKPKNMDTSDYKGAYVKKPKAGVYRWVADLDASSLYPSIIDALNISPETYICRVMIDKERINPFRRYMFDLEGEMLSGNEKVMVKFRTSTKEMTLQELKDMFSQLFDMQISIAGNGAIFRNDIDSIFRIIIRDMKKIRSQYKNAMIRTDALLSYLTESGCL